MKNGLSKDQQGLDFFWHTKQDVKEQGRLMEEFLSTILNILFSYPELAVLIAMGLIPLSVLSIGSCTWCFVSL